jgi:AraC-like DNA-binding protein
MPSASVLEATQLTASDTTQSSIDVSQIKPLAKLLVTEGIALPDLLVNTGIELEQFTRFKHAISFEQYIQFIENARRLSCNPVYALTLGEQFFIHHDGVLACRVMSSEHTLAAMKLLTQYQTLFTQILQLDLDLSDHYGVFSISERIPLGEALPHFIEYSYSCLFSLGKFCLGSKSIDMEIEFAYPNPGKHREFEHFFNNPVRFNATANRVIFPRETLTRPIIFRNQQGANENEQLCQKHLLRKSGKQHKDEQLVSKVNQLIKSQPLNRVTLESISRELCMSSRSLRRHLSSQNISFSGLLEAERKRAALQRLSQKNTSMEQLASELGYQSSASFSRAFKRWYGEAPNAFRRKR